MTPIPPASGTRPGAKAPGQKGMMDVTPELINAARDEARRFLDKVDAAHAAFKWHPFKNEQGGYVTNHDTKSTAALRRASMDLTRALAELRKRSA